MSDPVEKSVFISPENLRDPLDRLLQDGVLEGLPKNEIHDSFDAPEPEKQRDKKVNEDRDAVASNGEETKNPIAQMFEFARTLITEDTAEQPEAPVISPEVVEMPEATTARESAQKIGKKVLKFASRVLQEVAELPRNENAKSDLKEATQELTNSKDHLQEELEELRTVGESDSAEGTFERNTTIIIERTVEKPKAPGFAITQLAILAIAGAGIFMAAIGGEGFKEGKSRQSRKRVEEVEQKNQELSEQLVQEKQQFVQQSQELRTLQQQQVEELKHKEQVAFVHQVSEVTEHQAQVTHEVVERLRQPTHEVAQEALRHLEAPVFTEVRSETAQAVRQDQAAGSGGGGQGAAQPAHTPLRQPNATLLQKAIHEQEEQNMVAKQEVKSAWLFAAIFTTAAIVAVGWLVIQLVING